MIAQALIERETLNASELEELMTKGKISDASAVADAPKDKNSDGEPAPIPAPPAAESVPTAETSEDDKGDEPLAKPVEPKLNITRHE